MLKKVTFGLIAVLGSVSALAGHGNDMPMPSGVNLMAPHQEGSWSFGAQANYFEPNNDFNYALASQGTFVPATDTTTFDTKTHSVNADYDWGWGVDVTYHFPGEGRDVTLAFTQLNSSDSDSVSTAPGGVTFIGQPGVGNPFNAYDAATGHVDTNYDSADLTFGQVITAGSRITLHPFAGLRYAYIDYKATGTYSDSDVNVGEREQALTDLDTQTLKSTFNGIGPRLGSDAAVNLGGGFSLRGTLGVSLLVGSMDVDTDYDSKNYSSGILTSEFILNHDVETNTRVVPEADAKLSAMYHTDFNNGYGLGFEAGWQVTNYFDAIENNSFSTFDTSTEYTNFFMQGPYARIQLDVA